MYQNMDCVVWGYSQFYYSIKYDIYNSANEKIENPVYITNNEKNIGVMVPYGGYIDIQMDSSHGLILSTANSTYSITEITIENGGSGKIKVVRDYYARVTTPSTMSIDNQVV